MPHVTTAIDIALLTDEPVHEATADAANGSFLPDIDGEIQQNPYFEILDVVSEERDNPGIVGLGDRIFRNDVIVQSTGWLDLTEVRMFHSNVDDLIEATRHTGATFVLPALLLDEADFDDFAGVLAGRATVSQGRITREGFEENAEDAIEDTGAFDRIEDLRATESTFELFVLGDGASMGDISEFARSLAGPRRKTVVDFDLATSFRATDPKLERWRSIEQSRERDVLALGLGKGALPNRDGR